MVVLLVAVPMGMGFDLLHAHSYAIQNHEYQLSEQYLVAMPDRMFGMFDEFALPDFSALKQPKAWKWVFMFFVIGSLESLLSAKAVDLLDPWKRKTNMDRDVIAVGVGNLCASMVGGLPMISEIVRSKANIDNGARTRFADMWHGIFLLICVAMIPTILHRIPLAALAAMLVYTGYRFAHPNEFIHVYRIGREQLAIFVVTLVAVLATDLLIGIAIGIGLKMLIHLINGVPLNSLFRPFLDVEEVDENTSRIVAHESAVFSNWIPFRRQIEQIGLVQKRNLIIDVSDTKLVDHSTIEKLEQMEQDFEQAGLRFEVQGLETLQPFTSDARAARKRVLATMRRLTITADAQYQSELVQNLLDRGATRIAILPCTAFTSKGGVNEEEIPHAQVRLEFVVDPIVSRSLQQYLRNEVLNDHDLEICVESVDVVRPAESDTSLSSPSH